MHHEWPQFGLGAGRSSTANCGTEAGFPGKPPCLGRGVLAVFGATPEHARPRSRKNGRQRVWTRQNDESSSMILAGDIGGTKVNLACFEVDGQQVIQGVAGT